ncbi:MAG: DUF3800 domain-containing protein [Candidatus Manganitrophus sp. SB1]|nr:DUF3800 domain-containing protein [Candidatus Manganitrophus morganii]
MHIFVDEAGPFIIPPARKYSVSCVGALVIRDLDLDRIFTEFEKIKKLWGISEGEIKGSKLNEEQIATVIYLLSGYDVIFEITAIDMAMQTPSGLTKHRLGQAEKMIERVTDGFHENVKRAFHDLREQLKGTSNQLYVQAVCSFELLYKTVQHATLYYAQRCPKELDEFYWKIDAKNNNLTPYEDMWQKIILPILQSKSFLRPFIQLIEADYSYFEKYFKESPEPPRHLAEAVSDARPFQYVQINKIYKKHLAFEQSHKSLGLQMVDILTTSVRRAMNGNLQPPGWSRIGQLMVQASKNSQVVQILDLSGSRPPKYKAKPPYWKVVPLIEKTCKQILV